MAEVIVIAGKAQHGKDTAAETIKMFFEEHGKKVLIAHYADYLKFICKEYLGWDGKKDDVGRSFLQKIGTDTIRKRDEDFWVNIMDELMTVLRMSMIILLFQMQDSQMRLIS